MYIYIYTYIHISSYYNYVLVYWVALACLTLLV